MELGNPIAEGNTAKIYLYKNKIIKLFHDRFPDLESEKEACKQNYAFSCGLFVPKVIDVTRINGKQAIFMEYIPGKTIGDLLSENPEQTAYYMNISVDIQQEVHTHTVKNMESMVEKLNHQITSAHRLSKGQISKLTHMLHTMPVESRLCHGDFHFFNLIISQDRVAILDWVDASSGDFRADVYRTYLLYSQISAELAEMYLEMYCTKSGLSRDEIFAWAPIIAGARLAENVASENQERLLRIVERYVPAK